MKKSNTDDAGCPSGNTSETRILAIEIPIGLADAMERVGLVEPLHALAVALTPAGSNVIRHTLDGWLLTTKGVG